MFCQKDLSTAGHPFTVYLEVSLPPENPTDLNSSTAFCIWATRIVRYGSLPAGLLILLVTTAAFLAVRARFRGAAHGVGTIFLTILVLDFLNGIACLRLFEQFNFEDIIQFHGTGLVTAVDCVEWVTWWSIYTSWVLKFFLCMYELRWFSWSPGQSTRPMSRLFGWFWVTVCGCISMGELTVIVQLHKDQGTKIFPFLVRNF